MDSCDVLIAGGGPAGSTCAWALVRAGFDVVVMDRSPFPRDKVCAGWITPQVVESLELDLAEYARRHTLQSITGFACALLGHATTQVRYDRTVSHAIRRYEFDDYLLRRCDARLKLGEAMSAAEYDRSGWLVNGSIRARWLVGAGGHFCPVARLLGAEVGRAEGAIHAQEAEFAMTATEAAACPVRSDAPELYFCADLAGYGWCVRKGDYLNVGLGREGVDGLPQQLRHFRGWLQATGRLPATAAPHFRGHAYLPRWRSHRRVAGPNCLLIGDAAGLAYRESGEGIRPAVESALLAASLIQRSLREIAGSDYQGYQDQLMRRFGGNRDASPPITPSSTMLKRIAAQVLLRTPPLTRHILLDRWFLRSGKPPMRRGKLNSRNPVWFASRAPGA